MGRKRIDLTGKRYGRLVVLGLLPEKQDKYRRLFWRCQCDCGNTTFVMGAHLTRGTQSCGCLRKEKQREAVTKPAGEAAFNSMYRDYQRDAGERGLSFILSKDTFKELTSSSCHYCGCPPTKERHSNGSSSSYFGNGIDRKDNSIGYAIENCVPCCWSCNYLKRGLNYDDFIDRIKAIAEHLKC